MVRKAYTLENIKTGEIFHITDMPAFCKENGWNYLSMHVAFHHGYNYKKHRLKDRRWIKTNY